MSTAEKFKFDFQTPIQVAKFMVSLLPDEADTVLEPTPGSGNIVSCLNGYNVTAPADFFQLSTSHRFDAIVMNPPFSAKFAYGVPDEHLQKMGMKLGYHILNQCLNMSDCVIALMPWFTISDSDVRLRSLKRWGLKSVTALPRKTFQFARIQTCVLELRKGFVGDTIFRVYDLLHEEGKEINNLFENSQRA
jgi:type I restriction-modification system DNA methylase subunit